MKVKKRKIKIPKEFQVKFFKEDTPMLVGVAKEKIKPTKEEFLQVPFN